MTSSPTNAMRIRVGTRGSALALWQTRWVCDRLRDAHANLDIDEIIIKTHGDIALDDRFGKDWPVGAFVSALENALIEERIDFAVHSFKDLQTAVTTGLIVAAVPRRELVHDALLTSEPVDLDQLPSRFRVGTGSPRRSAQFRRWGDVDIVPIRGNVQTRIDKIEGEGLGGVVLAAAGLKRLGIEYPNVTELPTDRFVPSPAQGALAIQTRDSGDAMTIVQAIDDPASHKVVLAERAFLQRVNAGCHVPIGALGRLDDEIITLHGQLFDDAGERMVEAIESGADARELGERLADRLMGELGDRAATQ